MCSARHNINICLPVPSRAAPAGMRRIRFCARSSSGGCGGGWRKAGRSALDNKKVRTSRAQIIDIDPHQQRTNTHASRSHHASPWGRPRRRRRRRSPSRVGRSVDRKRGCAKRRSPGERLIKSVIYFCLMLNDSANEFCLVNICKHAGMIGY